MTETEEKKLLSCRRYQWQTIKFRKTTRQEQYSKLECIEAVGLLSDIHSKYSENMVENTFGMAAVTTMKRELRTIHKKQDKEVVMANLMK